MICDLHTHSDRSDGSCTPARVVELAAESDVGILALTDHDDVSGLPEARARGVELGVELLAGVEVSVCEEEGELQMHVLGLGIDPEHGALADLLARVRERRAERAGKILAQLRAAGVELDPERVAAIADGSPVGRPHIARALVDAGVCEQPQAAFARFLRRGRPGYVISAGVPARAALDAIHDSGGIASLAHPPLSIGVDRPGGLESFVERLARQGLDAIEVWHPNHQRGTIKKLRRIAWQRGLVPTGGSDFHGDSKPDIEVGRGRGALALGPEIAEAVKRSIRARRELG